MAWSLLFPSVRYLLIIHFPHNRYVVLIFSLANYANSIGLNGSQAALISALCMWRYSAPPIPQAPAAQFFPVSMMCDLSRNS